jgi:threonine dehydratase
MKVARMRDMGAEVRLHGHDVDAAKDEAQRYCDASGSVLVEDGREVSIAEGAGTIARELLARNRFDAMVLPLGNGSLLNGAASWIKAHAPGIRVIGVCAEGADSMAVSWKEGRLVERNAVNTIADGIAVRRPVPEALSDMVGLVDDVLLVGDDAIQDAMRAIFQKAGLVVEPAGAVGVAAAMEHPSLRSGSLATVLCGSNLTQEQMRSWLFD